MIVKQTKKEGWKEVRLGDLFEIITSDAKTQYLKEDGAYIVVDMGSISSNGNLIENKRTDYNNDFLEMNDLIMPKDDIGGGKIIGKVAIISEENKYILGDHVYCLRNKTLNSSAFIKHCINSHRINKSLKSKANGTSQLGLNKKDLIKQTIFLPSKERQVVIVNLLNSYSKELEFFRVFTEKYKIQKQGLMQKLLTGKWRVQ